MLSRGFELEKGKPKAASENGLFSSSQEAGFGGVALGAVSAFGAATRTPPRLADTAALGSEGRFVTRGMDLDTEQLAPIPDLVSTRTAE